MTITDPTQLTADQQERLDRLTRRRSTQHPEPHQPRAAATAPAGNDAAPSHADGGDDHHHQHRARREMNKWSRLLHVYTSMIAFVIILFFGATGLTLNHPSWTFGSQMTTTTTSGEIPIDTTLADGSIDFLSISEFARDDLGVTGSVTSFDATNGDGSIAYRNAGYSADLTFSVDDGTYDLTVEQAGWVGVINDMHKGRDTGSAWSWVIDLAAGFLVVVSLTGLVMQFFLRKRRRPALTTAVVGGLAVIAIAAITLR